LIANKVFYDNTVSELTATNLQTAVDELEQLIQENTSVIKVQRFVITNPDNGNGTFSYTYNGDARTGNLATGTYGFALEDDVEYIVGENRVEVKINNDTTFYAPDVEMLEVDPTTIAITYAFQTNDEIFFKVYQGLDSVALVVPDGTITTAKLSTGVNSQLTAASDHILSTNNPHQVTKTQLGLGNVTNDAQVKKAASSTDGFVPKWNGTTGDAIVDGYGVQTTLASSTTELVRADAIAAAIATKQDTLVSGTNIKTINGSNILGEGDYEIDIPAVSVGTEAPTQANVGDLWWNSNNGVLYIYYNDGTSSQWVEVSYADVQAAINQLVANAPEALNTLNELAAALGDDANFATTVTSAINAKAEQTDLEALEDVVDTKSNKLASFEVITGNHTIILSDTSKILKCQNTTDITISIPGDDTFPVGTQIAFLRNETGAVTFQNLDGLTKATVLYSIDTKRKIKGQYASAAIIKTAEDATTNYWQLVGSLEA